MRGEEGTNVFGTVSIALLGATRVYIAQSMISTGLGFRTRAGYGLFVGAHAIATNTIITFHEYSPGILVLPRGADLPSQSRSVSLALVRVLGLPSDSDLRHTLSLTHSRASLFLFLVALGARSPLLSSLLCAPSGSRTARTHHFPATTKHDGRQRRTPVRALATIRTTYAVHAEKVRRLAEHGNTT